MTVVITRRPEDSLPLTFKSLTPDSFMMRPSTAALRTFELKAPYVTPTTIVEMFPTGTTTGNVVISTDFIDTNTISIQCLITLTVGTSFDLRMTDGTTTVTESSALDVVVTSWVDMRLNGAEFTIGTNDSSDGVVLSTGAAAAGNATRTAEGFSWGGGPTLWANAALIQLTPPSDLQTFWDSETEIRTVEVIFQRVSNVDLMIAVGDGDAWDPDLTVQYWDNIIGVYLQNNGQFVNFWGSTDSPPTNKNAAVPGGPYTITVGSYYRVEITGNGSEENLGRCRMYTLPSGDFSDWDNSSSELLNVAIPTSFNDANIGFRNIRLTGNGLGVRIIAVRAIT